MGNNSFLPLALAKKANKNLVIGDHVSIQTDKIDTRAPVKIGNHVIIGNNVEIITASHDVDSPMWTYKTYGIEIEDYVWIATNACVLPSVRKIGRGSVIGACSCVVRNVEAMAIVSGNPAVVIRRRQCVHSDLCTEALLGGDLKVYLHSRLGK